jgi:uncharacterized protein YndB with AHSA1/START domain
MGKRQVSVTRTIVAPPETLFELLADPAQHPLIDGSGSVLAARDGGPQRLELGSKFGMDMRIGAPYKILNTVVEFEEDRLIAWRHFNGHRWRWRLEPAGEGRTEVTETFDWSKARMPLLMSLSPFPRKNKAGIQKSLDRLAAMFPG